MEKPLKFKLHILSPVHIGCDDVYEPTNFVIDEKKQRLIEFDPLDFIKSLSAEEKQRFTAICMQGNVSSIVNIYKFISGKQVKGREVEIAKELISQYKRVRDLPTYGRDSEKKIRQELNQFAIGRTAYNPHNNLSYIPGSSLKGSLRTAYLSILAKEQKINDCWNKYLQRNELEPAFKRYDFIGKKKVAKRLEKDLLQGDFATDPFRMVKVSDFLPIGDVRTKIVYAVNKKKERSDRPTKAENGPPQILEIIQHGSTFEGLINIQQPEQKAEIKRPIQTIEFLKSINDFYITAVNEEDKITKEIGAGSIVAQRINDKFKDRIGKTVFLLRIGRHSGAEAVTIEGNRNIKIMQARGQQPKYLDHATTLWLASETSKPTTNNGLLPFGWAVMEAAG